MTQTVEARWGAQAVDLAELSLPSLKAKFVVDRLPTSGCVLEIGSGNGKILRTAAAHRPMLELFGCDVKEPTEAPDVYAFRRMNGDSLPYEDASMDVVLVVDVLEHVPDPQRLISEAARVLRSGGRLIAFVPIEGEKLSFYEVFRVLLGKDTYALTKEHIQAFTHRGAKDLLAARFDVRETRYAYHALGHLMDAAFFAAAKVKSVRNFWWTSNTYYNPEVKDAGRVAGAMNAVLVAANVLAAAESTLLAKTRFGSAGLLVEALARLDATP